SACGKSSLTIRLCEGRFSPHHDVTIGVEFGSRIVPVGPPHTHPDDSPADLVLPSSTSGPSAEARPDKDQTQNGLPEPPRVPPPRETGPQKHMKLSLWD